MIFPVFRIRWLKRALAMVLGVLIGVGAAQLVGLAQAPASPWEVGTEPAFPPFEMKDEATGNLTGFDIELMTAMGEAAGREVKFITLPFDGLIPALQSKTISAAISGMTITAERAQTIDFSRPYFKAGLAIAVQESNDEITSLDDLKGKRIAVAIGTTGADQAAKVEGATVSTFDNSPLALQELLNGRVDAVVNDLPVTLYAIREANLTGLKIVGELVTEEYYGIALPKNSENLEAMNTALETLLAHQILRGFLSLDALTAAETQAWISLNDEGNDEGNDLNLDPLPNEAILARAERYANQARVLQGNVIRLIDAYRIGSLDDLESIGW